MQKYKFDMAWATLPGTIAEAAWIARMLGISREEAYKDYRVVNEDGTPFTGTMYPGQEYHISKRDIA